MKNLSRNVTLYCDICRNDQFSTIDDLDCELQDAPGETKIKCSDWPLRNLKKIYQKYLRNGGNK